MPTLVSMARSGETFITRDDRGRLWLHLPEGAGGTSQIDETTAERAVIDHAFLPLDRRFETWQDLDDFRQRHASEFAAPVEVDPETFDRVDVEEMIDVAKRWLLAGEGPQAQRLLTKLLRAPVTLTDADVREAVLGMLDRIATPTPAALLREPEPTDATKVAARRRWEAHLPTAA